MCSQAMKAYLSLDASSKSYTLLQMIANVAYQMGHFFYALKAFDVLERLDPSPEYWEVIEIIFHFYFLKKIMFFFPFLVLMCSSASTPRLNTGRSPKVITFSFTENETSMFFLLFRAHACARAPCPIAWIRGGYRTCSLPIECVLLLTVMTEKTSQNE